MKQFGVGHLFGVPIGGNQASPNGPVFFGTVQDVTVDFTRANKALRGQYQGPDDLAAGDMDIKVKATFGNIEIGTFNKLFFGQTISAGIKITVPLEAHTGAPSVQVTNHTTFLKDNGVINISTGAPYNAVSSGLEVSGVSYSVNTSTGTYAFAAGDTAALAISYTYTSGSGNTLAVKNQPQGYAPAFELWLTEPYQGTDGMHLWAAKSNKLSLPLKRADHLIQDFEAETYPLADGSWFEFFQISA